VRPHSSKRPDREHPRHAKIGGPCLIAGAAASPSLTRLTRVTITGRSLKLPSTVPEVSHPHHNPLVLPHSSPRHLRSLILHPVVPSKLRRSSKHPHHGGQSRRSVPGGYDAAHGRVQHAVDQVPSRQPLDPCVKIDMLTTTSRTCNV
jgi:hypothetical protein